MARKAKPNFYVKIACFDNTRGVESCCLSFIVQRPAYEPGFRLIRQEAQGRKIVYTIEAYAPSVKTKIEVFQFQVGIKCGNVVMV
jgi:ribulose-bisphosphate carboxylase small chain